MNTYRKWIDTVLCAENPKRCSTTGIDSIIARTRICLVSHLSPKERESVLIKVYGEMWSSAGVFPGREASAVISDILAAFDERKADPLTIEEYRRLERALDYSRRVFCIDLDGLLVEGGHTVPGIIDAIRSTRPRHGIVVATAADNRYTREVLSKTGLANEVQFVFTSLASLQGKNYSPIARYFGYHSPQQHLVAVGHSFEDMPSDIDIPLLYLNVSKNKLAHAFRAGINIVEDSKDGDEAANDYVIERTVLDLGERKISDFVAIKMRE